LLVGVVRGCPLPPGAPPSYRGKGVFTLTTNTLLMSTTARLRNRRVHLERRATASKAVRASLVSLAGLIGGPVTNEAGEEVGRVVDVVARLYGADAYPPVTGLVLRVGRRRAFLSAEADSVAHFGGGYVVSR
jgi:hypothetical protein